MNGLLQTQLTDSPATVPGSDLLRQASHELPGDQSVCLGVDEEKWPDCAVLVLDMVAHPGDVGVGLQLPPLSHHQPQVVPQTEFVGVIDGEVGRL